jgi:hypothetical protein
MPKFRLASAVLAVSLISGSQSTWGSAPNPLNFPTLGALSPSSAVVFDTDALTVSVGGVSLGSGVPAAQGTGLTDLAVFSFDSVSVPAGVTVKVVGSRKMALLSRGGVTILGGLDLSGAAGANGAKGADGKTGNNGQDGVIGSSSGGFGGAQTSETEFGGKGGNGGFGNGRGGDGSPGTANAAVGIGRPSSGNYFNNSLSGTRGGDGSNGAGGQSGSGGGSVLADGTVLVRGADGTNGAKATNGKGGSGGGGGGGGSPSNPLRA